MIWRWRNDKQPDINFTIFFLSLYLLIFIFIITIIIIWDLLNEVLYIYQCFYLYVHHPHDSHMTHYLSLYKFIDVLYTCTYHPHDHAVTWHITCLFFLFHSLIACIGFININIRQICNVLFNPHHQGVESEHPDRCRQSYDIKCSSAN